MADALVGNIVGNLRIDTAEWQRGLQQASQQLQQFARQVEQMTAQMGRFGSAFQQATGQQQRGLQALGQTAQATTQTFQQFNTQLNQTTITINQARQAASGFGSAWSSVLQIAGGIGLATSIQGIVSALRSMAAEVLQSATRMESLRAQFTAFQGAAQAAVTLQSIFTTAQRLGVEFGTLATSFRGFMAATQGTALEGERAQRVFEQITTGTRAMGASSEQTGRALLALQQMVSKGVVSQEELRQQLGEALPGSMGIAARAFGVTTQEMNKMIEKGMDAITFVQAFGNQVEREFAGKATTATNTLTAAWQRFSNELEQFKGSLAGGELVGQLRDLANWAARFLETMRQARELRQEALGGTAPVIPPEMAGMGELQARQKAMDELRKTVEIGQRGFAYPGEVSFFGGMPSDTQIEQARAKLLELQKMQRDAIQRIQDQWAAEADQPATAAMLPGARTTEAIRKRYEEGIKELQALDVTAAFVKPLELAEEKAKAWHKVMQDIRQEAGRIGEGLRSTLAPGKTTPFDEMITRLAGERGLDPNLMRALIEQESGFNPQARSSAGAMGLMQLMPGTARQYGAAGREFDPETNLRAGMNYFAKLLADFNGNVEKALTAYNAGPGRGGIPLPYGENATFAQDVRRRMPQGAGGLLERGRRLEQALQLGVEAESPDRERLAQIRATGQEYLHALDAEEREAHQEDLERRRQVFATGREYLQALETEEREAHQDDLERRRQVFATGHEYLRALEAEQQQALAFTRQLQTSIDTLLIDRIPMRPAAREEALLRAEARREGRTITPEQEVLIKQRTTLREEQERLNVAVGLWRDLSQDVGGAWVSALSSIADGTKTVAEAFRAMGQSIMKSMADIAAQQAFQAIFKLGVGLLTGALTGGATGGAGGSYGGMAQGFDTAAVPYDFGTFQHGGRINSPTLAMLGEGPSSTMPEYVLNRQQMDAVISRGGGQGGPAVSIHNYPSRAEAEAGAAQQRAQGHTAIVNSVLTDLSAGSGSRIGRAMRMLQP